jgi:hypothetical protein
MEAESFPFTMLSIKSTPAIKTYVRYACLYSSESGDSGSKKCKRGYGGASGGLWRSLRLAGIRSRIVGSVMVRLVAACFSRRESFGI